MQQPVSQVKKEQIFKSDRDKGGKGNSAAGNRRQGRRCTGKTKRAVEFLSAGNRKKRYKGSGEQDTAPRAPAGYDEDNGGKQKKERYKKR